VSKEEIVGLLVALERFVALDHAAEQARQERRLDHIVRRLAGAAHLGCRLRSAAETGRIPLLEICLDEAALGRTAFALSLALQADDPPVHLGEGKATEGILTVNPAGLQEGDEEIVATRLLAVLRERQ